MATKEIQSKFEKALNFEIPKDKIETITDKQGGRPLSYVSWAYAWGMFKQIYPDASYEIVKNEKGLPFFADPETGIMVYTKITASGETHEMWLFVMNSTNKAMRLIPYTYKKWDSHNRRWEEKGVEAATMFDINKTLMRCLVKNMAMFGFGLNIYNGDDLPEFELDREEPEPKMQQKPQKKATRVPNVEAPVMNNESLQIKYSAIWDVLKNLTTIDQMMACYNDHKDDVESNAEIKELFGMRKEQIKNPKTA